MITTTTDPSLSSQAVGFNSTRPVAIDISHVSKSFRVRQPFDQTLRHPFTRKYARALNDFNCEIRTGEFFGFLGANGAGKTTLFKILATLVSPDEGTVTINGLDVMRDAAAVRRELTPVICDERSLKWRLSARENLRLYAVLYDVPAPDVDRRVDEVLEIVGLDPSDQKLVGRFSSGLRQRLLIARALIPKPRILLLDEPTRSLDPVSARALRSFLRDELCRSLGCTILLATHSTEEAFQLCDRVAILHGGRPVVVGETEKLALTFGEDRYRIWTRTPGHPAFEQLVERRLVHRLSLLRIEDDGWARLEIESSDGHERAAQVLEYLTSRGVSIARFERVAVSLGELIQSVTGRGAGGSRA